jgi:5-methyltetrahydrofolate--homocysteine methyltransferase
METIIQEIFDSTVNGNRDLTGRKVQEALDAGTKPGEILHNGLVAAMAEVGRLFEEGEYFVPEMLVAARAMQQGMNILKPHLVASDIKPAGRVVAGTVKDDLHDIGKNLVCLMLEGAGYEIKDMGVGVTPDKFVEAIRAGGVDVLAMSALLTTTMSNMRTTIEALKEAGVRDRVKVIVGGAPVTEQYARQIGADGYAANASQAVTLVKSLLV